MKFIRPMWTLVPMLMLAPAVFALTTGAQDHKDGTKAEKSQKPPPPTKDPNKDTKEAKDKEMKEAEGAAIGAKAPQFTLKDTDGKEHKLSDYAGKTVVLEWFNPQCPFVVAAHEKDGALRDMSAKYAREGVVWLSINSSAPGKEGAGLDLNKKMRDEWKIGNPVLLDESGDIGRAYGAKSTPHMFIIDAKGMIAYKGALDNAPRGKVEGDKKIAYVEDALAEIKAGKPVTTKETRSYGCSVKYGAKP